MNDKSQIELAAWLSEFRTATSQGKDFVIEQAPDVVRDIVSLGRVESVFGILFWSVGAIIALVMIRTLSKFSPRTDDESDAILALIAFIASCLFILVAFVSLVFCLHDGLAAFFAPKVYVLREIAELLKKP